MKKIHFLLFAICPLLAFSQTKEIAFAELTPGSGMFFGAVMTTTDITVTVQGPSDRFIAFGFGTGMATGNDAIIWSTLGTGAAPLQLRDHRMIGQGVEPSVDAQQDWTVSSNTVSAGNRTIVATRALSTGDANDVTFSFAATTQNLFWAKGPSATNQLQYHGASNRASGIVRNWVVPDVTPPTISSFIPADNAVGVNVNTNLTISFSEAISWGTGSVILYDGNDNVIQTISNGTPGSTVSGSTFFYNPPVNLVINTPYYVQIDATAFKDAANNFFAGIADNVTWNFNTNDITPPALIASPFVPADNSIGVALTTPLSITFNEAVQAGSGEIQLYDGSGVLVEAYDVLTSPLISFSGAVVTIDPTDLVPNTNYYVNIQSGAVKDQFNNNYAGFTNNTTWNFNTNDLVAPLAVAPFSPADDAVDVPATGNFSISFTEDVQISTTGMIEIFTSGGTLVESFVSGSPQITVSGDVVNFATTNPLTENTSYYVNITPGFIEDLSGNDFAGITTNTLWNFTVGDFTAPVISNLDPADNSINVLLDVIPTITFNENIVTGSGSFYLVCENDGTIQEFSTALSNITVTANSVALNQSGLTITYNYHVLIDNDAVMDAAGNAFTGISDTTAWSFKAVLETGLTELKKDEYSWNGKEFVIKTTYSYGEVLDAGGRRVRKLETNKTVLDNLPAGIYTVRIIRNNEPAFLKIYVD
ncbi:Ig-like domain-containing protein [uncultured Fluviicola sp.]|uniref:Ig-like domain-containing protein n=1 Tax=uncultured Fluviicola sp. TaxID=463303 RepID=UPI0025CCA843|nr:Ig-like domain-containing protein [uncultured Fluviicola sp.]